MYKILLLGTNKAVIDDFFRQLVDSFEILSSSLRYEDVMAHIKYVKPDVIVYCLKEETRDDMSRTVSIKNNSKNRIPFIIIGNDTDCHAFEHCAVNIADRTLVKPLSAQKIKVAIMDFLKERELEDLSQKALAEIAANEELAKENEIDLLSETMNPETSSSRKHILIVDDDAQMLKTIKRFLEDKYDVATAISGNLALRFLQKKHTDLVLLDYEMPQMKGSEVLEQIRSNDATQNIPVIFLTGMADREKIQQVLSLNPQGYILKPTDKETLHAKLAAVLHS
ncbi:MAG: response regulator [Clostridiales bacterium]|nr:response regulator [Eubacterium sp.]MDD7349394.1 response regulator [Clostridiales bacterium]MDY3775310.1 response regulator [Eubacterium sp.]